MKDFHIQYGPWALVTGASSGIGLEFANQLAKEGLNLIIVARRKEILDTNAKELGSHYNVQVKSIVLDLTKPNAVTELASKTKDLDIGLVIPNAGIETHGHFLKVDIEKQLKMLQLNCIVPMQMAHQFGQRLIHRGHGGIVFVASTFAYQAVPYFANYAASKSYILFLGEALHEEFKAKGIDVTTLSPGLTQTEMPEKMEMDLSKLPMKAMDVKPVVKSALSALKQGKALVVPGSANKLMAIMSQRLMPRQWIASTFGKMNKKALPKELL